MSFTLDALARAAVLAAMPFLPMEAHSQAAGADTTSVRTYGGFVDTYYGWDFNRPTKFRPPRNPVWPLHAAGQRGRNDAFLASSLALTF